MGAIQDSINSIITTAAVGAAGYKKLKGEAMAAEAAKTANAERAVELEATLPGQEAEIKGMEDKIEFFGSEHPELGSPAVDAKLAEEAASGEAELPNSLTKAKEALDSMQSQRAAKITLRDLTKKRIEALRGGSK